MISIYIGNINYDTDSLSILEVLESTGVKILDWYMPMVPDGKHSW